MARGFFWSTPSENRHPPKRRKTHEVFSLERISSDTEDCLHEEARGDEVSGFVEKSVERAGELLAGATKKLRWAMKSCNAQNDGYRQALKSLAAKAQLFKRGLLPFGNQVVDNLEDLSRDYLYLNPDRFADRAQLTLEKIMDYRNHAELANLFYMEMVRDLEDLKKEFANRLESLRQTEEDLHADVEKKRKSRTWSEQLAILAPVVGVGAAFIVGTVATLPAIATGITGFLGGFLGSKQANRYRIEEIALKANADMARKSSLLLESGDLLERILEFSKAMSSVGEYFNNIEADLIATIGLSKESCGKTRRHLKAFRERMRLHQKRHVESMERITTSCRSYAMRASDAQIDIEVLNSTDSNTNYIEDWLINQKNYRKGKQKWMHSIHRAHG